MKKKIGLAFMIVIVLAFVLALVGCSQSEDTPPQPQPTEDENTITLKIQLDLKEDIGLLLIDHNINGESGSGGISNANKSMIKHNALLDWTFNKQMADNLSDAENLSVQFKVLTEYVDPNFEGIYPKQYMIPVNKIFWKAHFGETYYIRISGDKTNGYNAVLEK